MPKFTRQTWALTKKTLLVAWVRFWVSTWIRAFLLPIAYTAFIVFARYLFIPPADYGVGTPVPVQVLADSIKPNLRLVLVTNGLTRDVQKVVDTITKPVIAAGKTVRVLEDDSTLGKECKQSLKGVSECYAIAVFQSSPDNPNPELEVSDSNRAIWNYTLRGDSTLGIRVSVIKHSNDIETRILPLQNAIDFAIAQVSENKTPAVPEELMYTSMNKPEREAEIRRRYQKTIIEIMAVTFLIGIIGVVYQEVGFVAMERELGLSQLVEAMGGSKLARLLSYHLAFDIIYLPGWVLIGLIIGSVFSNTNRGALAVLHILAGLSFSSCSLFGASFFRKAQLSGITVTIVFLILGIIGQVIAGSHSKALIAILSLFLPPMNYLYAIIFISRWERQDQAAQFSQAAPESPWQLKGGIFWVFFVVQIIVYPLLAMAVENALYGVKGEGRLNATSNTNNAVEIRAFTRRFVPGFWGKRGGIFFRSSKRKETVVAVDGLNLDVRKGSIVGLLGANGSGKTTTLESVVGLGKITEGTIALNADGGIGVCPQKNILWDHLTVEEHVKIWNKLKCEGDDRETLRQLIRSCDLEEKSKAQSRTLSGGQKRKLQLAIMFTGGSNVCAVDEVSSGLDPLSRRKIWDIILEARGRCTIILTTHFLDEADLLSDHIAILSKGRLKAEGSSVELKASLGGGYRVKTIRDAPDFEGVSAIRDYDHTVYTTPDSRSAGNLIEALEKSGVNDFHVNGPTIEDVFLKVAADSLAEAYGPGGPPDGQKEGVDLYPGRRLGVFKQSWVMFRKRLTILRRNYLPTLAAVVIPIIAAGITTVFFKGYEKAGCAPDQISAEGDVQNITLSGYNLKVVIGPPEAVTMDRILKFASLFNTGSGSGGFELPTDFITFVDTIDQFNSEIQTGFRNYTPGGFFLREGEGEHSLFAYLGNKGLRSGLIVQNMLNNLLTNTTIAMTYKELDFPWAANQGKTLEFIVYFGLAMALFPAFFALYPNVERLRQVRALHYSNGVRPLPLWFAYLLFDFMFALLVAVVVTVILAAKTNVWYGIGYLFLVLVLYGIASILLSYVISLYARSQLSAFAFSAGGQAVMFLLYFIAYMNVLTYAPLARTDEILLKVHWGIATITPIGNLVRSLFVALNSFQTVCRDDVAADYLGTMTLYGGPIVYLIGQSLILFSILLWSESGVWGLGYLFRFRKSFSQADEEITEKKEIADELTRVTSTNDVLKVVHLTKQFGKNLAVDNVTLGVSRGEVFGLLGPNGAGKTTTINMIRGDMTPDDGEIFVENISVIKNRAGARSHLGVCPQFDAMDQMTVAEHLTFYARARGVENVEHNVQEVIRAVGLETYANRMAAKLSGGNKRKLSLGIALMGNPTVVLLDEPSSGMDAASKRVMWKTLAAIVPGRCLVLTTHSMEEADALATRAGILAKRMLALGTVDYLRRRHGDKYHVHIVLKSAPQSTQEEMQAVNNWILKTFIGAELETKSFHGQLRFSVPARPVSSGSVSAVSEDDAISQQKETLSIRRMLLDLENNKEELGLEHYSVSQTSLEDIFLKIVGEADVAEEGYTRGRDKNKKKRFGLF